MPTTFYLRDTQCRTGYTPQSSDTANHSSIDSSVLRFMLPTKGSSLVCTPSMPVVESSVNQYWFHRAFATPPLGSMEITAGDWLIYSAPRATIYTYHVARFYCYVLRAGLNVGYIFTPISESVYNSSSEYIGRIVNVMGEPFTILTGDQIVLEVWSYGTSDTAVGQQENFACNGATEIVDESTVNATPAAKIVAPLSLNLQPTPGLPFVENFAYEAHASLGVDADIWQEYSGAGETNMGWEYYNDNGTTRLLSPDENSSSIRMLAELFPEEDYNYSFKFKAETVDGAAGSYLSGMVRMNKPGAGSGRTIYLELGATSLANNIRLIDRSTGTAVVLFTGTYYFVAGTTYICKMQVIGMTVKCWLKNAIGTNLVVVDNNGAGYTIGSGCVTGKPGLKRTNNGGNNYYIWDFLVEPITYSIRDEFYQSGGDYLGNLSDGISGWEAIRGEEGLGLNSRCSWLQTLPAIGNHENDAVGSNAEARMSIFGLGSILDLPYQQTESNDPQWKQRYYYYTWGPVLIIWIDQYGYGGDGTFWMQSPQHRWLKDVLEAHKNYKFKIMCAHTSLHETDPNHSDNFANYPAERAYLLDLIDQYGVNLYAHGHYHGWMYYKDATSKTTFICTTFGAPRTHTTIDEWTSGTPGGRRYARVMVNWNETTGKRDPDSMSILLVDPVTNVVTNTYVIAASDKVRAADLPWSYDALTPSAAGGDVNLLSSMWTEYLDLTPQNTDFRLSMDGGTQSVRVDSIDDISAILTGVQYCGNDYVWTFKWKAVTLGTAGYLASVIRASNPGKSVGCNNLYMEMGAVASPSNNVRLIQRYTFNGVRTTNTIAQVTYAFAAGTEYRAKISIKGGTVKAYVCNSSDVPVVSLDNGNNGYNIGDNRNIHGKPGLKRSNLGGNTYRMWDFVCNPAP